MTRYHATQNGPVAFTAEEEALRDAEEAAWIANQVVRDSIDIRTERNKRLADSDWTQQNDSPLDPDAKLAWQLYREALRMVPQQTNFPWEIDWPPKPGNP
jgi:hypothetical protein